MLNNVSLVGRLTKDAELRYTPSNVAVATFTLAVNRTFKNENGDREADFINCVMWRQQGFRAVLFRMVPKHLLETINGVICFRAVLFRMVPKLLYLTADN